MTTTNTQPPNTSRPAPPSGDPLPDPIMANRAALIATFYYQRDLMAPLKPEDVVTRLVEAWTPKLDLRREGQRWRDPAEKVLLRHFTSIRRAAHDTTVVQVALNADQASEAATGWTQELRPRLQAILTEELLQGALGYTLTYQAVLTANHSLNEIRFADLLTESDSRFLHLKSEERLSPLAMTDIAGGRVWLLEIPIQDNGLKAATVYIAVCPQEANDQFVAGALYGPNAALFMPDLIAHKSYHQIRQYWGYEEEVGYGKKLATMRNTTVALLEANLHASATDNFDALVRDSHLLIGDVARLGALRISLAKQLYNYQPYAKTAQEGEIAAFHHAHMRTVTEELNLKVAEGQTVLQATDTAVHIVEARIEKAEEKRQQKLESRQQLIGMILAVMGVAFAVPQLIDRVVAAALLDWYKGLETPGQYSVLQLVWVQGGLTIVIAFFVVVLLLLIYNRSD